MSLRPITLLGIVISMVTGIAFGITGYHAWQSSDLDSADIHALQQAVAQIQLNYVDDIPKQQLVNDALRGMLDGLDNHSNFLDASAFDDLQAETRGHFGGIGIELGLVEDYFTVVAPLDDTPAAHAGLQSGDRIVAIDQEPLRGKKLVDVVKTLRGPPGSDVHLRLRRADQSISVSLTRAMIEIASVKTRWLEPGYAYIRISQFQTGTGDDFTRALERLQAEHNIDGLVLDLRNNPGGVLQASVAVADAFLENGLIVYTEGRLPSSHLKYRASGADLLNGAPIVVLINQGSASASEIVAGALKDHARATLVGTRSYGKGSVQSVLPLTNKRAIKLTTAYYFTPNGETIHKQGIEPDVTLEASDNDAVLASAVKVLKGELHARL